MSSSPSGKRKLKTGILRHPTFGSLSRGQDDNTRTDKSSSSASSRTLHKKRPMRVQPVEGGAGDKEGGLLPATQNVQLATDSAAPTRPSLLRRGRPSSLFGSLKSLRTNEEDTPPTTATSSKAPSFSWRELGAAPSDYSEAVKNRSILHHGEAQTNSGMFWKRREYLVLTETHLVRFKNQLRAADTFPSILSSMPRPTTSRHTSNPSGGSGKSPDMQSAGSDVSNEISAAIPLEQVVAVYRVDEARTVPTLEVAYLENDSTQGSVLVLQLANQEDLEVWTRGLRFAADKARLLDTDPITPRLAEYAARVVEHEQDYDVSCFRIFKVVKRLKPNRSSSRSSNEDFSKSVSQVCFLALGARAVHIVSLPKNPQRVSSPSLAELNDGGSFGILALTSAYVHGNDNNFKLTFRVPFQKPRVLHLASLAACEIAMRLRQMELHLRPGWMQRPCYFEVPGKFDDDYFAPEDAPNDDLDPFDRTLMAYCIAYGTNPSVIRYCVNTTVEDEPRFELLEPAHANAKGYSAIELLAILRSLRYNELFQSVSLAGISLDILNGVFDTHGAEHVCTLSTHGVRTQLAMEDQRRAPLLVQEVRALAISSRKLRRLDFSFCISNTAAKGDLDGQTPSSNCGIVEALFPLCKLQATNIDWIALNGIELQETDLDYLVSIAAEKAAHFRAIEASRCGLTDRGVALLLDVFRAHENTLEALDISNNTLRLVPSIFSRQLHAFNYIRKLDLSNVAVVSSTEPLLPIEVLCMWRLEDLRLRGIALNEQSVAALSQYLEQPLSETLRELILSNCSLTGRDAAQIMQSMTLDPNMARYLHLDLSDNRLSEKTTLLADAIARDWAPTHLSMRSVEYDDEDKFERLLIAFASNKSIRYLDLGKTTLPGEAGDDVCQALYKLLAENRTIEDLDISGEDSRLEVSKLGTGINEALNGLKHNTCLRILRVQYQRLGHQGAGTLADVLKENKTLEQLHCDHNAIALSAFTDLVNALAVNRTLLYLPTLSEGRAAALKQTEQQIKEARTRIDSAGSGGANSSKISSMRRTFANISGGAGLSALSERVGRSNNQPPPGKVAALPQWTERDVQAALRLVNEGWEAQASRLEGYLERNWRICQGLPFHEEPEDAKSQRPSTAGSLGKVLQRVMEERTPTVEEERIVFALPDDDTAIFVDAPEDAATPKKEPAEPKLALAAQHEAPDGDAFFDDAAVLTMPTRVPPSVPSGLSSQPKPVLTTAGENAHSEDD